MKMSFGIGGGGARGGCFWFYFYIEITKKKYHNKKKNITFHLYRNSLYNILGRDNCFFFVIIVFCNFLADYKGQKKKQLSQKKTNYHVPWTQIKHRFDPFWHKKRYISI